MQEVSSQIAVAALSSTALQWLKQSKYFPWITEHTTQLNRAVAVLASFAGAAGIDWKYDHAGGTLMITGLTWVAIRHFLWDWVTQFCIQHGYYHATSEPSNASAVAPVPGEVKTVQ